MAETIRKRSEIPEEFTWNLCDMYKDEEAWKKEYEEASQLCEEIKLMQGKLSTAQGLLSYFRLCDRIEVLLSRIYGYASLSSDQDTANSHYLNMKSQAMNLSVSIASASSFADPELMMIPEEDITRFYEEEPALLIYQRAINRTLSKKAHILSAECEALLSSSGDMANGASNIAAIMRNADLKWDAVKDASGTSHTLTNSTLVPLLESSDRNLRKKVFCSYYNQLGNFRNTIAATLDAQFRKLKFYSTARHYASTLEASLDATEVPVSVYTNLLETIHENLDKMHRYITLRKKMLCVDELHMYDIYTPLMGEVTKKYTFDEAKDIVLKALAPLGQDYTGILQEGFDHRWIDIYENEGKCSGAYSSGCARPHPYVLMNYTDNLDGVFTLAHEMGHSLHSYFTVQNQPINTADYVIFVAEVASTVNEVLLMKYLLAHTDDQIERAHLINNFLEGFKGTVYRQAMLAEFELYMGQMCESGNALTADTLNEEYLRLNKLYYGPDMISDPEIAVEWARIPHLFYNYYVFQYATGYSAAVAIANRILTEGAGAVEEYKKFLSSGSSQDPVSLLKIAGIDMSSPAPVRSALQLFGELVDEMTDLCDTVRSK